MQPRPQAKPQRKASWPNWKSKVPGPTANVEVLVAKHLCERLHNFQHRPQTKPQRKASGPNWKSKVPGPQPMWKFWFLNKCVKICTIYNTGPRPSPRRRHQGQLGKVRCQVHSHYKIFCFPTVVQKTHQIQPRPQATPQRKASWPNWESKLPGPQSMWNFLFQNK